MILGTFARFSSQPSPDRFMGNSKPFADPFKGQALLAKLFDFVEFIRDFAMVLARLVLDRADATVFRRHHFPSVAAAAVFVFAAIAPGKIVNRLELAPADFAALFFVVLVLVFHAWILANVT